MNAHRAALVFGLAAMGALACDNKGDSSATASPSASTSASSAPEAGAAPSTPMNVTVIPTASVAAMVNPRNLPAYTGKTGSVEGTVSVIGDPPPASLIQDFGSKCPDAAAMYGKQFREGAALPSGGHALADAIVIAIGYAGFYIPEREEARKVSIHGCAFDQRTITLTYGQRLEVKNEGSEFFGPQFENAPGVALMLAPPGGDPVKLYPPKPGHYIMNDARGHAFMQADVYAMLHPLHAVTNIAGHYRIDGVPVGKIEIHATHPHIAWDSKADVEIVPDVVKTVDLVITYHAPEAGPPIDAGPHPPVILH